MYTKVLDFIKYNNAFTIILFVFFFGFGISFAASPEVREGIYSSEEKIVSVDNSWIVSADLDNFNFNLRITSITEDGKNYYVTHSYQTLVVEDGVWQSKEIGKTLTVNKEALDGKDLGLYLAKELGENINYELSYLKRVQKLEKEKGESRKIVTVEYSGLIGKLLNPTEKVIEGYSPVIPEVVPEVPATVESNPEAVIVSTQHPTPEETTISEPALAMPTENEVETPTENVGVSPESTSTETSLPAPGEMVNESLVKEVVDKLIENEASSTPPVSEPATSSPESIKKPLIESTSTPEAVPEPTQ